MHTLKTILAVLVVMVAVVGILACGVGVYYAWSLNAPVTDSLTRTLTGVERALTAADTGLARVDEGLGAASAAVSTIEGAVATVGETLVNTNIAFTVVERTVGDTLFPRLIEADATARSLATTVVAFNETLEAANQLPFVSVPTLTEELQTVADRVGAARTRVDEIRAEMQAIKEQAVGRPVTAITSRTAPLVENLDAAQSSLQQAQSSARQGLERAAATKARLPRTIDLISLGVTLVLAWLIIAQGSLAYQAWGYLRQKTA